MAQLNILDLTSAQAERVEELAELPLDEWGDGNKVKLLRAALAVFQHDDVPGQVEAMEASASLPIGQLIDAVALGESDPEVGGEPT